MAMRIINRGRGIHQREIPGLEKLQELPDNWCAFTNMDLSLPGKGIREIDVVLVTEDRLILIDLKDWTGPITSEEGNWLNRGRLMGLSPVTKIADISRAHLTPLLKTFLKDQAKKERLVRNIGSPKIDCAVVLTRANDKTGIAASEVSSVFTIDQFVRIVRNQSERNKCFGEVTARHEDFTRKEWMERFKRFFNTQGSIFQPGTRKYGRFSATRSESPTFIHRDGIFAEFDVEEEGVNVSSGLLRRWDFSKAHTRFQSEEGRAEIAGRERSVIAWLDDRNPRCGDVVFKPKEEDPDRGVAYWEVFERRRRMKRLSAFAETELKALGRRERVEIARQVLSSIASFHDLQAAHMDLGAHSVWVELPTTVKLSHLMAASIPEVRTLGQARFQFLSSAAVPEDVLGLSIEPLRKDVFLLGCVIHTLLFDAPPSGDPPEWDAAVDSDGAISSLHPWFERALEMDPGKRFPNASEMLSAFNAALSSTQSDRETIEGLERYATLRSQRQVFQKYPEDSLIHEDERVAVWRSNADGNIKLVKLWKASALGDITKERSRILAFLEKAKSLIDSPLPGVCRLIDAHWTGDAVVLVQEYVHGAVLSEFLADAINSLETEAAIDLVERIVEAVDNLHARSFSHGDIKPDNIIITEDASSSALVPTLVDVLDFSSVDDGERISRAYTPDAGGCYERDRYAVTRVAEEILDACPSQGGAVPFLRSAIQACRIGPPANGTLLPIRDAIVSARNLAGVGGSDLFRVSIPGAVAGALLSDEGRYWVSMHGPNVRIRGATEELFVSVDLNGMPTRARRSSVTQAAAQRLRIHEKHSFVGEIFVDNTASTYGGISELLARVDLSSLKEEESPVVISEEALELDVISTEAKEDALSDKIALESADPVGVDVPLLWRRLVEIESELRVEVAALGESSFRPQVDAHIVPVQVTAGDLEFGRDDVVTVERLDSRRAWVKIGHLDIEKSSSNFIQIRTWIERSRGPLVAEGDRLRFQSRFENTSRQRREEAVSRILRRTSAETSLIDVFSPSAQSAATVIQGSADEAEIRERYSLNPSQVDAFMGVLRSRPLGLLQGPPGTGKTRFIGSLVHYVLTKGIARNVLVASQSHEAVNNAAEAILKLFGTDRDDLSLIRVGKEASVSDALRPYHVAAVERAYKDHFRATMESRLGVAARALGVTDDARDAVIYFERAIKPILLSMADLVDEDGAWSRVESLRQTIEQVLRAKGFSCDLADCADEDLGAEVEALYFSKYAASDFNKIERLRRVADLARDVVGGVSTWQRSFETFLAGTRQVVAGTCVGLGRESLGLVKTSFDLVVVDEAARCTSSELAVPIQAGKWVVLVGDHAQLEPFHPADVVEMISHEIGVPRHEIVRSDFERVFGSSYGQKAGFTLKKQHRMLPPIGRLVSGAFYDRALQHGRDDAIIPPQVLPSMLARPLVWVCTDGAGEEAHQRPGSSRPGSLQNPFEADVIVSILRHWSEHAPLVEWLAGRSAVDECIGVICAYASQRDLIWKKLRSESLPEVFRRSIKVDTIDSYQGKENLIVLVSLVRNNSDGAKAAGVAGIAPGFLGRKNRINVALSRAMDRLVIVGAKERWFAGSPLGAVSAGFDEELRAGCATVVDAKEILGSSKIDKKKRKRGVASGTREGERS